MRDDAIAALERAAAFDPPAPSWSVAWFSGLVNLQNGAVDEAISNFRSILEADSEEMRRRGFDFSRDVRLHNELGLALFERAKRERGPARAEARAERLHEARESFERALVIDPENVTAHYNLGLIHAQLGDSDSAVLHRELHARYKPDDNARDRAIAIARRADPAADHAAEAIVIYDLHRPERFEGSRAACCRSRRLTPDRPGEGSEAGNAGQKARATELEVSEGELAPEDDAVIGRVFARSLKVLAALAAAALIVVALRYVFRAGPEEAVEIPVAAPRAVEAAPRDVPVVAFTDITAEAGIDFVHVNGAAGEALLPETMGAGGAFFDVDRDGDQDLLLVNSTTWDAVLPEAEVGPGTGPTMSLYENDGAGQFADRTAGAGLEVSFYGTGVAVGDVDGDGWTDVFVSAVGSNRLFRNMEGERFEDVTAAAGVAGADTEWSSSSAFFDADGDGDLDLLVGNYVRWSREIDIEVGYQLTGVGRAYGPPLNYGGTTMDLYRNDGSGVFTDASEEAGMHILNPATDTPVAKTLGLAPVDIEGDGDIDVVVANDTVRNFLLVNDGNGVFTEDGELYGLAYGRDGAATGGDGRRRRRLPQRRRARLRHRELRERDDVPLRLPGRPDPVERRGDHGRHRRAEPPGPELRTVLLRLRSGRTARPSPGERPSRRRHRGGGAEPAVPPGAAVVLERRARRGVDLRSGRARAGRWSHP